MIKLIKCKLLLEKRKRFCERLQSAYNLPLQLKWLLCFTVVPYGKQRFKYVLKNLSDCSKTAFYLISCDFSEFCTYVHMCNYLMLTYAANASKLWGFLCCT